MTFQQSYRLLIATSALGLSAVLASGGQDRPLQLGSPDRCDQLNSHVHAWAGEAVLYSDAGRQRFVLGVDSLDGEQRKDGAVDQIFLFGMTGTADPSISIRGHARLQYWHSGLRVTFPDDRRTIEFATRDSVLPPALAQSPFPVEKFADLGGLAAYSGPIIAGFSTENLEVTGLDGPIQDDGGGEGGPGGGGGSCQPLTCSVGCTNGSCATSCFNDTRAACVCDANGSPHCACQPC